MNEGTSSYDAAVSSTARNLLVIAPPGCGKTELLARRAALLIAALAPNQRILALTFSNKAKANLSERLVTVLGAERKRRYITVHNFHGHAAEIVRSHGRTLGIDTDFEMPDKRSQSNAITPHLEGLSEDDARDLSQRIENDLREAKQSPNDDVQVLAALDATGVAASIAVERARQADNQLFYDDLLRHAQRLIRVPEIANLYRKHYSAILVDEFQDLSPQQLDLALRSVDRNRCFVGDPLQGIYSWTGARPAEVEKRLQRLCGEPLGLGVSYRSSPAVLQLLNAVSGSLGGKPLETEDPESWHEGGLTAGAAFETGVDEAQFIENTAAQILAKRPDSTIGIICRSGWRRKPIDAVFLASQLPSTRWELAIDNPRIVDLIQETVNRLGASPDLETVRANILASIDSNDVDTASDVLDALDQLETLVDEGGSIGAALANMRLLDEGSASIGPGVHLLNAHTGKGQQFDWVFIPGFEDGVVPSFLAKSAAQIEEEHRVLLVMISRARHAVVLTRARSLISKKGRSYKTEQSRWTGEVRPALTADQTGLRDHIDGLKS